jgi:hypothetical protein
VGRAPRRRPAAPPPPRPQPRGAHRPTCIARSARAIVAPAGGRRAVAREPPRTEQRAALGHVVPGRTAEGCKASQRSAGAQRETVRPIAWTKARTANDCSRAWSWAPSAISDMPTLWPISAIEWAMVHGRRRELAVDDEADQRVAVVGGRAHRVPDRAGRREAELDDHLAQPPVMVAVRVGEGRHRPDEPALQDRATAHDLLARGPGRQHIELGVVTLCAPRSMPLSAIAATCDQLSMRGRLRRSAPTSGCGRR